MATTRAAIREEIFHYGRSKEEYEAAFMLVLKIKGLYRSYWELKVQNEELRDHYVKLYQHYRELEYAFEHQVEAYQHLYHNHVALHQVCLFFVKMG